MTALYKERLARWSQISLRGFFVLVTVLGIAIGWVGVQVKWIRDRHETLQRHDSISGPLRGINFSTSFMQMISGPSVQAPWEIRIFGEAGVGTIVVDSDTDREQLTALFPEAEFVSRGYLEQLRIQPATTDHAPHTVEQLND